MRACSSAVATLPDSSSSCSSCRVPCKITPRGSGPSMPHPCSWIARVGPRTSNSKKIGAANAPRPLVPNSSSYACSAACSADAACACPVCSCAFADASCACSACWCALSWCPASCRAAAAAWWCAASVWCLAASRCFSFAIVCLLVGESRSHAEPSHAQRYGHYHHARKFTEISLSRNPDVRFIHRNLEPSHLAPGPWHLDRCTISPPGGAPCASTPSHR
jgi:hypothetical protein